MRKILLATVLLGAAAPVTQSYDLIATAPYTEPDGTVQAAGTCVGRVAWNGSTPYAPAGVTVVLDVAQTTACYVPFSQTQP